MDERVSLNTSDKETNRRLRDVIAGLKHQNTLLKLTNNNLFSMNSKLFKFMDYNDLWHKYKEQRYELE